MIAKLPFCFNPELVTSLFQRWLLQLFTHHRPGTFFCLNVPFLVWLLIGLMTLLPVAQINFLCQIRWQEKLIVSSGNLITCHILGNCSSKVSLFYCGTPLTPIEMSLYFLLAFSMKPYLAIDWWTLFFCISRLSSVETAAPWTSQSCSHKPLELTSEFSSC